MLDEIKQQWWSGDQFYYQNGEVGIILKIIRDKYRRYILARNRSRKYTHRLYTDKHLKKIKDESIFIIGD